MEVSTVASSTASNNNNNTNNNNNNSTGSSDIDANTTTNTMSTNRGQLIGSVADDIHLQSHQQKSQQLMITVNKSVSNSFANNLDNFNNSIIVQNYNNATNFPNKIYHETSSILKQQQTKQPDQIHYETNQNNCDSLICNADLIAEVRDILDKLVLRVDGELLQLETIIQGKQSTTLNNNEQIKVIENAAAPVTDYYAETNYEIEESITFLQNPTPQVLKDDNCVSSNSDDATGDLVIDSVQPLDLQDDSPEQITPTTIQFDQTESSIDYPNQVESTTVQHETIESAEAQVHKSVVIQEEPQLEDYHDDSREEKTKDIITLRNLEISPPPTVAEEPPKDKETIADTTENHRQKRRRTCSPEATKLNESTENSGRSKRQRRQTKLFQAGDVQTDYILDGDDSLTPTPPAKSRTSRPTSRIRKKSTTSSSTSDVNSIAQVAVDTDQQIASKLYEKNDYLAIRNEDNSFYLCQLTEDVDTTRTMIKVRWLDIKEGEKFYFLTSQNDLIPQASIIMPVTFPDRPKNEKKGKQYFELEEEVRENIMERLKRSLNMTTESASTQESGTDGSQVSNAQ